VQLYQRWREQAGNSMRTDALTTDRGKLTSARDVLNAAWLLRLERPQDNERVATAAGRMCRQLLVPKRPTVQSPTQDPIPLD
jgi:hypothetical protein